MQNNNYTHLYIFYSILLQCDLHNLMSIKRLLGTYSIKTIYSDNQRNQINVARICEWFTDSIKEMSKFNYMNLNFARVPLGNFYLSAYFAHALADL
ncbi:hypothetical protein T4A_7649 [Trichinella pseudospiralis]|uniref:Uncharacterized protein n=1 Tax=Trichinella pseudospiralis TaxID=6337 RepID=A0A0V1K7Q6_TRIPS|nr:hypothetical protein T4A_7649 [Trichinella pseudospiralis]KRZ43252.1 hypothetical protein T4C_11359 [Trichinella pseudospiralis]